MIDTKFDGVHSTDNDLRPSKICLYSVIWALGCSLCGKILTLEFYYPISSLRPISKQKRHNWKGHRSLSVKCTPPTLVSISTSSLFLSGKLCFTGVHRSVQNLGIYRIISRLMPVSYTRGIPGRAVVGCPSNAHPQHWCLSTPFHHLC